MYQNASVEQLCQGLQNWMDALQRPEPELGQDTRDTNWRTLIASLRIPARSEREHVEV